MPETQTALFDATAHERRSRHLLTLLPRPVAHAHGVNSFGMCGCGQHFSGPSSDAVAEAHAGHARRCKS